jgi:hypothetical protein
MDRHSMPSHGAQSSLNRSSWRLVAALVFISWAPDLSGQEIPAIGQRTSDFYNAQGNRVRVEWKLDRTTVPEDEDVVATLRITGATNPQSITRPDLRKLEAFESRFVIAEAESPPPAADAKEVKFNYRLRPRNRTVDRVPTLAFCYHNPAADKEKAFPVTTAKEVRITVTAPRRKTDVATVPLGEPQWLLAFRPQPVTLSSPSVPGLWVWLAIALGGPAMGIVWFAMWRRAYPDASRLARMRRSRAARRATDRIRLANHTSDPPAAIAGAFLGYLRMRFPLAPDAVTPTEVSTALTDLGIPCPESDVVVEFLRACDAERFAPRSGEVGPLMAQAVAIVNRLEAA